MFCDRNEKMMVENARAVRSIAAHAQTTPLRNEAQLNCVALRSSLDYGVARRPAKGQDERFLTATPLTVLYPVRGSLRYTQ